VLPPPRRFVYHPIKIDQQNRSHESEDATAMCLAPSGPSSLSSAPDNSEDPSTRGEFALLRVLSHGRSQCRAPVIRLDLFDAEDEDDSCGIATAAKTVDVDSNSVARKQYTEGLQAVAKIFDDTPGERPPHHGLGAANLDVLAMLDETVNRTE
jgi:hypothetical protein